MVFLWIDRHDKASEQNAQRIAERLRDEGVQEVRQLPSAMGMDANDLLAKLDYEGARQAILDMFDQAKPIETGADEGWPLMLNPTPPAFPLHALPDEVAAFVKALSTQFQTAPDLAALAALGVLCTAAMNASVDCGNWDEETLALYILVGSPSGDRKSSVLKKVAAPLYAIQEELREEARTQQVAAESRRQVLNTRKSDLERKVAREEGEDRLASQAELDELLAEMQPSDVATDPRLFTNDATPEALVDLMHANPEGIGVFAAESAVVQNLFGHYSDKGNPNLNAVCEAYTGDFITVDRRGKPPLIIPRPRLGITLFAQEDVLATVVGNEKARTQGLVGRFVLIDASPASYVGDRQIDPPPPKTPRYLHEAWEKVVRRIRASCATKPTEPKKPESGGPFVGFAGKEVGVESPSLSLSHNSKGLLTTLEVAVEPRLRDGADLEFFRDWMSRHHGRVARLASTLHLVEGSPEEKVSEQAMRWALEIGEYFLQHALLAVTTPDPLARRANAWLADRLREGVTEVSQRDIHVGPLGGHGKSDGAARLCEQLVSAGALRAALDDERPNPKGGRPRGPCYEINPRLRRSDRDA